MDRFFGKSARVAAAMLLMSNVVLTGGCATLLRGTEQTVAVDTQPSMGTVRYGGFDVYDGQVVTVNKTFSAPYFTTPGTSAPAKVKMKYQPDAWLLGDVALLFAGVWPGVVALTVDFATGSWRNLNEEQTVPVSGPTVTPAAFRAGYSF